MPRNAAQLRAAATATGLFNGPDLSYVGDGYSVPYQVPAGRIGLISGVPYAYKVYLDTFYLEYSRLHDWLYTPYHLLISASQEEADLALREELATQSPIDAEIVYQACSRFGHLWFGRSPVGYHGILPTWFGGNMGLAPRVTILEGSGMANIKVVILFQQTTTLGNAAPELNYTGVQRTAGWSESFYGPNDVSAVRALLIGPRSPTTVFPLLQARANILASSAQIIGVRLYLAGAGKGQPMAAQYVGGNGPGDQPSAALLMSATANDTGHTRRWQIRGVVDEDIKRGEFTTDAPTQHRYKEYFDSLGGFGWLKKTSVQQSDIFSINSASSATAPGLLTTRAVHGFGIGNIVTIKNTTNTASGNRVGGEFKVSGVPDATSITLLNWTGGACKGGTVSLDSEVFQDFAQSRCSVIRATNRKVGRPFAGYRGRSSRRRTTV